MSRVLPRAPSDLARLEADASDASPLLLAGRVIAASDAGVTLADAFARVPIALAEPAALEPGDLAVLEVIVQAGPEGAPDARRVTARRVVDRIVPARRPVPSPAEGPHGLDISNVSTFAASFRPALTTEARGDLGVAMVSRAGVSMASPSEEAGGSYGSIASSDADDGTCGAASETERLALRGVGAALLARAKAVRAIRAYFEAEGFLEVDTPCLVPSPGLDLHLDAFRVEPATPRRAPHASCGASEAGDREGASAAPQGTREAGDRVGFSAAPQSGRNAGDREDLSPAPPARRARPRPAYLGTSPEYQMKRLLAGGVPRCFQIARCFRAGELGTLHNPEFTMLEWYRGFASMDDVVADTERVVRDVVLALTESLVVRVAGCAVDLARPFERLPVAEAFERHAGVAAAEALALAAHDEERYFRLLVDRVEPALARYPHGVVLVDYPASQASLARLRPDDPRVCERFELYVGGIELCNGFGELTDPAEQRARLERDRQARAREGKPVYPIDERFLAALEEGMPPSAGNALGIDRLVAIALGAERIADVQPFPHGWL